MDREFTYQYLFYQEAEPKRKFIAEYYSDAHPPAIGTSINLGKYLKDPNGPSVFKVISVLEIPTREKDDDENMPMSTSTDVVVYVEPAKG